MHIRGWILLACIGSIAILSYTLTSIWTSGGMFILGHDAGYRLATQPFVEQLSYLWTELVNLGVPKYHNPAAIPIHAPEYLASLLSDTPHKTQQYVIFFWHIINFSSFLFAYLLYRGHNKKSLWLVFILASLLYAVNFFNLQGWGVFWRTRFSSQATLPLIFFYAYSLFDRKSISLRHTVGLSAFLAIFNGGGSPPLYGSLALVWCTTGIYSILISPHLTRSALLFVKATGLVLVLFGLFSAYWVVPYGYFAITSYQTQLQDLGGISGIASWADSTSTNSSISNIFRLQGFPMWNAQTIREFILPYVINPFYIAVSYAFPIAAFSAYIFTTSRKERQFVIVVYAIALLGIFFTAGTHPPFGGIYSLLLRYVPGFPIFRTPFFKFDMIVTFSYAILIGFTTLKLGPRLIRQKTPLLAAFVVAVLWSAYHVPFFLGDFFVYNRPFTNKSAPPDYVGQLSSYINSRLPATARILLIPDVDSTLADGYTWGYWSIDPLPRMLLRNPTISSAQNPPPIIKDIYQALYQQQSEKFLHLAGVASIEYLLFRNDTLSTKKVDERSTKHLLKQFIERIPSVDVVQQSGEWTLYSLPSSYTSPMVYAATPTTSTFKRPSELYDLFSQDIQSPHAISNKAHPDLPSATAIHVVSAPCINCILNQSTQNAAVVTLPTVNILPDSPLYGVVRWNQHQNSLASIIQANALRAAEFVQLYMRDQERTNIIFSQSLTREIQANVNRMLEILASETKSDQYMINHQQIQQHVQMVNSNTRKMFPYITDLETRHLFNFLGMTINNLEAQALGMQQRTYYSLNVPTSGSYTFMLPSRKNARAEMAGTPLTPSQAISLESGDHTIYIEKKLYSLPISNLVLPFGEPHIYPQTVEQNTEFTLYLRYALTGPAANVDITTTVQDQTIPLATMLLQSSDDWTEIAVPFTSKFPTDSLTISLSSCCFSIAPTELTFERFDIEPQPPSSLYFTRTQGGETHMPLPHVTYTRINPTQYQVQVTGAESPYTLVLNQQFDPHWQLRLLNSGDHKNEYAHTIINGFANGWHISQTGDYTAILEYWPQSFVTIGTYISLISIVCVSVGLILARRHDEIH